MIQWLQITAEISVYATYREKSYLYTHLYLISIYNITLTSTHTNKLYMQKYMWSLYGV